MMYGMIYTWTVVEKARIEYQRTLWNVSLVEKVHTYYHLLLVSISTLASIYIDYTITLPTLYVYV